MMEHTLYCVASEGKGHHGCQCQCHTDQPGEAVRDEIDDFLHKQLNAFEADDRPDHLFHFALGPLVRWLSDALLANYRIERKNKEEK